MTLPLIAIYLMVPVLVWRLFRLRWLKSLVILLWLGPAVYMIGFQVVLSDCDVIPYTALDGYLDCPKPWQSLFYSVFGPIASLIVILFLNGYRAVLIYFLAPLSIGVVLEAIHRRRR